MSSPPIRDKSVANPGRARKTKLHFWLLAKRTMEANTLFGSLRKEATCSICLGYFQDAVSIHCGHNFCRECITQCWGDLERNVSCPQCGESSQLRGFTDNRHLARIAVIVKCLQQEALGEGQRMCERHQEHLSVFCKEDAVPICLVCDITEEHRHHTVIPVAEAAEDYKDIKNTLNRCENQIQQPVEHSPDLEKRLDAFSEESKHLEEIRRTFKDALSSELESTSLLKHVLGIQKGRTKLFQLPYAEVVKKTCRRDQKSVRLGDVWQDVPDNPERFDTYPCVLGREGFTSGRHYWEVEVGSGRYWAVGFAKESVRRKGEIISSPEEQIWALQQHGDYFEALTYPVTTLFLNSWPQRVQVFLDYEENRVAFFDADTAALIYVYSPASFNQERILPWLWVWPGTELRLYH